MKNTLFLEFLLAVSIFRAQGKEAHFPAASIPDSLKKNAHAVVRDFSSEYTIAGPGEYTLVTRYTVTVLDEKGKHFGQLRQYYSKLVSINEIKGSLYDKNGREIKIVKKRDIIDAAVFSTNFVDDYRIKAHSFETNDYPYTTEYEVEITSNSTFNLQGWYPMEGEHLAVEQASLKIEYPFSFPLRYEALKLPVQPIVSKKEDHNELLLDVKGLPPVNEIDDYTPVGDKQLPMLTLVTDTFMLLDRAGSMATWKDMGRFFYRLNEGRDNLPPEVKKTVHELTDTCKTARQKISLLYQYLQKNNRYVSIQLGIGGWQTFEASFVCEKKYGDCKALSNLMKGLLREAGITSYAALVRAGRDEAVTMNENFAHNLFNHVIVCVPNGGDTVWLECTSPTGPAGYMSGFTSNRKVLLNTPEGGVVVSTPVYGKADNVLTRKATLFLNDKDELEGSVHQEHKGVFWDSENGQVVEASVSNANQHLSSVLGFSNYKIGELGIVNHATWGTPSLTEEFKVLASAEATRSGDKLILSTAMFPLPSAIMSRTDTSNPQFQLHSSFSVVDTVIIELGGNYSATPPFKEVNVEYPFGSYRLNYSLADKKLLVKTSVFTVNAGLYPAVQFKNYRKLRNELVGSSRSKVVLVKEK